MTNKICYYEILGIDRNANENDIKKAYRKLAIKWHPDKNPDDPQGASEMFKLIAEAYEILSNPETKLQYDRYGHDGVGGGGGGGRRGDGYDEPDENYGNYHKSSRKSSRRNHFDEHRAFDIFNHFFAEMGGDPFNDPFFHSFNHGNNRNHHQQQHQQFHQQQRRNDPFSDPFFSDPFAGFGGFGGFGGFNGFGNHDFDMMGGSSSTHFSTMSRNGANMIGTSTSTTTVISPDGTKKTRKETTTIHPDGRKETKVEEFVNDTRTSSTSNRLEYQDNNYRITNGKKSTSSTPTTTTNGRLVDSGTRVLETNHRSPREHPTSHSSSYSTSSSSSSSTYRNSKTPQSNRSGNRHT